MKESCLRPSAFHLSVRYPTRAICFREASVALASSTADQA